MELHDDDLKNFEAHGAAALPVTSDQGYVDHQGARIWYATFGAGPTVIMLHGGLGHSGNWGYQVPALTSSGYRAILIDSPGHGHSTRDERPYTYELMASDVLAVMDHLQLEKAAFVGWSDGACTALVLARNAASRSAGVFFFALQNGSQRPKGYRAQSSPPPLFQPAHQGLCPVVGHAGPIRALCRCSPPDAEDRTQLLCTRSGRCPRLSLSFKGSMMSSSNSNMPSTLPVAFRRLNSSYFRVSAISHHCKGPRN